MKDLYYYGRMTERFEQPSVMEGRIPLSVVTRLFNLRVDDADLFEDELDDAEEHEVLFALTEEYGTLETLQDALKAHGTCEQEEYWFGFGVDPVAAKLGFVGIA